VATSPAFSLFSPNILVVFRGGIAIGLRILENYKFPEIVDSWCVCKCVDDFGKRLIEKHGEKWVFTDFGFEICGKTREYGETGG